MRWIAEHDNNLQADLAAYWLSATVKLVTPASSVYCHYLENQQGEIVLLLPLVHHSGILAPRLTMLTSFYSSLTSFYGNLEPRLIRLLLQKILFHWRCSSIELAPLADDTEIALAVAGANKQFNFIRFERFVNYYQQINSDFAGYFSQRPALLRQQ